MSNVIIQLKIEYSLFNIDDGRLKIAMMPDAGPKTWLMVTYYHGYF